LANTNVIWDNSTEWLNGARSASLYSADLAHGLVDVCTYSINRAGTCGRLDFTNSGQTCGRLDFTNSGETCGRLDLLY
jgi:hypothetical protein